MQHREEERGEKKKPRKDFKHTHVESKTGKRGKINCRKLAIGSRLLVGEGKRGPGPP